MNIPLEILEKWLKSAEEDNDWILLDEGLGNNEPTETILELKEYIRLAKLEE